MLSTLIAGTALMLMMLAFARFYGTMFAVHESRMAVIAEQLTYPTMSLTAGNLTAKGYAMLHLRIAPMGYRIEMVVIHYRHGKPPTLPSGCRLEGDALVCRPVFNQTSGYYTVTFPLGEREEVLIEALTPQGARYFYRLDKDPRHPDAPTKYWISLKDLMDDDEPGDAPSSSQLTPTEEAIVCGVLRAYYGIVCGRDVNPASFKPVVVRASWSTSDLTDKLGYFSWSIYQLRRIGVSAPGSTRVSVRLGDTRIWARASLTVRDDSGRTLLSKRITLSAEGVETLTAWMQRVDTGSMDIWYAHLRYYVLSSTVRKASKTIFTAIKGPLYHRIGNAKMTYLLRLENESAALLVNYTAYASEDTDPYPTAPAMLCKGGGYAVLAIRLPWLIIPLSIKGSVNGYNYAISYNNTLGVYYVYPGSGRPFRAGVVELPAFNGTHILAYAIYKGVCTGPAWGPEEDTRRSTTPPWISLAGSIEVTGVLVPVNASKIQRSSYTFTVLGQSSPPSLLSFGEKLIGSSGSGSRKTLVYTLTLTVKPRAAGPPEPTVQGSAGLS